MEIKVGQKVVHKYLDEGKIVSIDSDIFYVKFTRKKEELPFRKHEIGDVLQLLSKIASSKNKKTEKVLMKKNDSFKDSYSTKEERINRDINEIIKERKIVELYHFTHLENLESILVNGLLSRNNIEDKNINALINDADRFDRHRDHVSISVSFPNYKLFYTFRNKISSLKDDWVVIGISPKLLSSYKEKLFTCHNAAHDLYHCRNDKMYTTAKKLENMFREDIENPKNYEYEIIKRSDLDIPINYTTDPQAEVLIKSKIELKYFTNIYSNSEEIKKYIANNFDLPEKIKVLVNPNLFQMRSDYIHWKKKEV